MRTLTIALVLLLPLALIPATQAETTFVTVTFRYGFATNREDNPSCTLTVPAGANGVAVLQHAFAVHCINGYARAGSAGATRLTCLNNHCESDTLGLVGWAQYRNGVQMPRARLEHFSAGEGDVLSFVYAPGSR